MASEIIVAENFPPSNLPPSGPQTSMVADSAAGDDRVQVENINGYSTNDYVIVGDPGVETTELAWIDSIDDDFIIFQATLKVRHLRSTKVSLIRANQIKSYRAANVDGTEPDDGDYSLTGTHDILVDSLVTEYVETLGGSGYWFKYTFFNASSSEETSIADAVARRGGGSIAYGSVDGVRTRAGFQNNRFISDQTILRHLISAISEVNGSLAIGGYTLPLAEASGEITNITELLASGFLLSDSYGPQHEGLSKDGAAKIKQARDMLAKIEAGNAPLIGDAGTPLTQVSSVRGYPNDDEATYRPRSFTFDTRDKNWR